MIVSWLKVTGVVILLLGFYYRFSYFMIIHINFFLFLHGFLMWLNIFFSVLVSLHIFNLFFLVFNLEFFILFIF